MHEPSLFELVKESNLINFAIVFGAIAYFGGKYLPQLSQKRREELETEIAKAQKAKQEAEEQLRELEKEIDKAKAESLQIVSNAQETAEKMKEQIIEEGKNELARLNVNTTKEIEQQKTVAVESMKKEIAKLAVSEIEKALTEKKSDFNKVIKDKLSGDLDRIKVSTGN